MLAIREAGPHDAAGVAAVTASANAVLRRTYRPNTKALENKRRLSRNLVRLVAVFDDNVADPCAPTERQRCSEVVHDSLYLLLLGSISSTARREDQPARYIVF